MRKAVIASFALLGLFVGRAEAQYNPVGPQENVSLATILAGGWTQCYSAFMSVSIGDNAENVLTPCQGTNIMMAGRVTGSDVFLLLAAGNRSDVTFNTGQTSNTHAVNGSEWYFAPNWSWGFAPLGAEVNLDSCDFGTTGSQRMCLHTLDDEGGYRIGDNISLNSSDEFEKVFFVNNGQVSSVPEPASMTLLATGLVGIFGAARRRWKTRSA